MVKSFSKAVWAAALVLAGSNTAALAEEVGDDGPAVLVIPRYQHLVFVPPGSFSSLPTMSNIGATVFIAPKESDYQFNISGFYGLSVTDYDVDDDFISIAVPNYSGKVETDVTRIDVAAFLEYQPQGSSLVGMIGARYVGIDSEFSLPGIADSTDKVSVDTFLAEVGLRFVSRFDEESRHAFSSHISGGLGFGVSDSTAGANGIGYASGDDGSGLAYGLEFAFGYAYLFDNGLVGVRIRGQGVQLLDDDAVENAAGPGGIGIGPEVNFSYRF